MNATHFIRTENLSEIIGHFKADHLIVIGDRNMKNRTIQVRRRAKLVEMSVEEAISYVWSDIEIIDSSAQIDLYNLLERYTGVRHYKERMERLKLDLDELDRLRTSDLSFVNENLIESHWTFSLSDIKGEIPLGEKVTMKLTQIQKILIRNHQQLSDAAEKMEAEQEDEYSRRGIEILDPNTNSNNLVPTMGICQELHTILYDFVVKKLLRFLEQTVIQQRLSPFCHSLFLWNNYYEEYCSSHNEFEQREDDNSKLLEWECSLCRSSNSQFRKEGSILCCSSCNSQYISSSHREEGDGNQQWLISGQNYRRANRRKKELKEKEEQNQFRQNAVALVQPRRSSNPNFLRRSNEEKDIHTRSNTLFQSKGNAESSQMMNSNQALTRSSSMGMVNAWSRPPSIVANSSKVSEFNTSLDVDSDLDRRLNSSNQFNTARGVRSLDSVPLILTPSNWDRDEIYQRGLSLQDEYADDFSHFTNHRGTSRRIDGRAGLNSSQELEEAEIDHLLSVPPSPTKPFSDLWSDSSSPTSSYLSLPSASFQFSTQETNSSSEEDLQPLPSTSVSSPSLRLTDQGIHLLFREEEMEERDENTNVYPVESERPCCCCGEESFIECTYCARFGLPSTFFCSPEHQSLMWKQHIKVHQQFEQPPGQQVYSPAYCMSAPSAANHQVRNQFERNETRNWGNYNSTMDTFHYNLNIHPSQLSEYSTWNNGTANHFGQSPIYYQQSNWSHSPSGVFT
eukprot:TRINITY_DN5858_c0_g2_i1.p1 TRINITY_DN5858_c0_g2~~TRINITY_DN5858_c0_g2_i1.p1  ORF type:complete len:736 (+),score=141.84 TRINITY_DN5858_c0_g2_i1:814-3021(+)